MKNKFKQLLFVGASAIIIPLTVSTHTVDASTSYKDVHSSTNWYSEEIQYLSDKGIISGVGNGKFNPQGNVTRVQASRIIWGSVQEVGINKKPNRSKANFKDVPVSHWGYNDVQAMYQTGIISGVSATSFSPNTHLTKAHVATMLATAFGMTNEKTNNLPYTDVTGKEWYYGNVQSMYETGIFTRGFDSKLDANKPVTREELSQYVVKAMQWYETQQNGGYEDGYYLERNPSEYGTPSTGLNYPNTYDGLVDGFNNYDTKLKYDPTELTTDEVRLVLNYDMYHTSKGKANQLKNWIIFPNGDIEINYKDDVNVLKDIDRATDKRALEILDEIIKPTYTEYDKVKAVYDYVVENTWYDYDSYEGVTTRNYESDIAYGSLVNHLAMCGGFSRAGAILLDKLGIENHYIVGDTASGDFHAWTQVKIEGEWYFMDLTYGDNKQREGTNGEKVNYKRFLVSDDIIYQDRSNTTMNVPKATSKKYEKK